VRGDWKTLRDNGNANQKYLATLVPPAPDVRSTSFFTTTDDGASIELRWYTKDGVNPGSAVVYLHGGGLIIANIEVRAALGSGQTSDGRTYPGAARAVGVTPGL